MTFEEMQKALETMLSVQRELQESQIQLKQEGAEQKARIDRLVEAIEKQQERMNALAEVSEKHEARFTRFYGYHLGAESDRIALEEMILGLRKRLTDIERKLEADGEKPRDKLD